MADEDITLGPQAQYPRTPQTPLLQLAGPGSAAQDNMFTQCVKRHSHIRLHSLTLVHEPAQQTITLAVMAATLRPVPPMLLSHNTDAHHHPSIFAHTRPIQKPIPVQTQPQTWSSTSTPTSLPYQTPPQPTAQEALHQDCINQQKPFHPRACHSLRAPL